MKIFFEPENALLKVKWQPNNSSLSVTDYTEYWISILRYVEVLKPKLLLLDMENFEYPKLPVVNTIFNNITELLTSQRVALVKSGNVLGNSTLENLLIQCPCKGLQVFNESTAGENWLVKK